MILITYKSKNINFFVNFKFFLLIDRYEPIRNPSFNVIP